MGADAMIIRRFDNPDRNAAPATGVRPAWTVFLATQRPAQPPCGIVFQADHAKLAGQIAAGLRPEIFGPLPQDVLLAISEHDSGWQPGDEEQIARMDDEQPKPFPLLPPEAAIPYWQESIRRAEILSPLTGVIVSRHFCALALNDPRHQLFLRDEAPRRERVESGVGASAADLHRWTAAIGFCDIVSLCLCSGTSEPAQFRLAHPALPGGQDRPAVLLDWAGGMPRFTSGVMQPGVRVSVPLFEYREGQPHLEPATAAWIFER